MSAGRQHAGLTEERWKEFSLDQQILMIGNEMNRARKLMSGDARSRLGNCYARVLQLTDLTVRTHRSRSLWRELLRWRGLIAELYIEDESSPGRHDAAFRALLSLTPGSYRQISLLF